MTMKREKERGERARHETIWGTSLIELIACTSHTGEKTTQTTITENNSNDPLPSFSA